nr:hypothetical protein B0A51_06443 [Rachicladosporium sp. CCFEE 5018]
MTIDLPPEVRAMTEDDVYRTSSQYRLWSFSPESLAALRKKTHELAVERIQQQRGNGGEDSSESDGEDVDFLTMEEELLLVQRACETIRASTDMLSWPAQVKATAVQYLRRFYLSNSPMTYPPKDIYKTCLYLANKTESLHVEVSDFAYQMGKSNPAEILAAEYKVMQALRFTLDVRQPNRGLKGIHIELQNMAEGLPSPETKDEMRKLAFPGVDARSEWRPPKTAEARHVRDRVDAAYAAARELLDAPALLTDVYFLYTPSQIVFAAMQIADPPLISWFFTSRLPLQSPTRPTILATIQACADILADFSESQLLSKEQRGKLEAKLEKCRDPNTRDMIKSHMAKKGGEVAGNDEKAKKRKLEREAGTKEGVDVFGPGLTSGNGA